MKFRISFVVLFCFSLPLLSEEKPVYLAAMAKKDITGPSVGVMFWGYAREDQTGLGIHTRQFARSLVIRDIGTKKLLAYVTAEVGGIPFEIQRDVVKRLQTELDSGFNYGNVLINASHTHSGPAGHFHYSEVSFYSKEFYSESYAVIRDGIFESIKDAYQKMKPAELTLGKAMVKEAGVNRSLSAYLANPETERKSYSDNIDREMLQLSVSVFGVPIGFVNWYGVHPTNITFDNRLISSDNKGIASLLAEAEAKKQGLNEYVAIFAQANEGDVSPNLNLNNTGPGKDIYESSFIIGKRQFVASQEILKSEGKRLSGGISFTQRFIDMSNHPVSSEFSGTGKVETTCPSAYGYSFAAGSTEEGGGHWLFHEGMTNQNRRFYIDWIAKFMLQSPSDELRECQNPKAVLFPMGETKPIPSLPQILPYGLAMLGDLTILVLPHEVTTMSSRRLKNEVRSVLKDKTSEIVLSGLTNDFSGYITTPEEYSTQNYEGGHTLHGPQSLNALRQEFHKMSLELKDGTQTKAPTVMPLDLSDRIHPLKIPFADVVSNKPHLVIQPNSELYEKGEVVSCRVAAANPNVGYPKVPSYLGVEILENSTWKPIRSDADFDTKFLYQKRGIWARAEESLDLIWETPLDTKPGEYRLVHEGIYLGSDGKKSTYRIECPSFRVTESGI
ncbi:neutral/alkaline ceramidase [Leptospira sp. 2 VSF19]|uniref:Neutral ceramidase n=1 Tax=Leptospira soteropolitanensis TaxID=2950025 RepID=A0AAW5VEB9_9LEPT|nr:neutral/alkaline non-lysosomal ceramidase N-terminal domain-containing protein [Leptospira soteropolitanensis]MCW7493523.1 neutral/alkaline ceramidase [Leptospira soteropolitanensis]MCW7500945.1 neutral/alkaline ceramidase [Leptospira soteropolitanensis]MCW7523375.1 neutral/alkaline ceramidase [Leptospira soteropolitanensis]MCW7527236.1 neutral/alkaline ceramidase [Leptospira soteropolitanensis]MCW7531093.1 neutral/alkaline ceramidase [Leptospira soteropolitanensis]